MTCFNCGGLIAEPGVVYGYAGKWCYCPKEKEITATKEVHIHIHVDTPQSSKKGK